MPGTDPTDLNAPSATSAAHRPDSAARLPATDPVTPRRGLEKLATYPYVIVTWVGDDGVPVSAAITAAFDPAAGSASFTGPAGLVVPTDRDLSITGSHIHPQPGYGYDERRHITVWGQVEPAAEGTFVLRPTSAWGWDESEIPFFEYSERNVGRARTYFDAISAERGTPVRPRLSLPFLALRATRLPFLTATIIPVVLGILIATAHGSFDAVAAILTIVGASFVQLGLNVVNDVFDTTQGADELNVTPTQYSGGSRVIQYGLVSLRGMAWLAVLCYLVAGAIGLILLATRGSTALLVIGVVGMVVSIGYTAPPLKLVYRGLGELAVAVGFGPLMLLGAYVVQSGGSLSWEPFMASLPVALLVALILYVNEIPDRRGDAIAGKRTLPVRFSKKLVVRGYLAATVAAFAIVVGGVAASVLPWAALVALAGIPLARQVHRGLVSAYDQPYVLMSFMGTNIRLHLTVGGLLIGAYALVLLVGAVAPGVPLYLG
jgi:1,4-dihydroxy-2-naphthoate octaprenyltransferase